MRSDERNANWFAVEAKSFKITVEGEGKKAKFFITERSRGNVLWIRFGEEGLFNLLKNVEECRNASSPVTRSLVWRENGRFFRLECKENKDGRFLLCSAKDVDGKKHKLLFPEGRGFLNGWALLAEKLRGMGIKRQEEIPLSRIKAVPTKEERIVRNGPSKVEVPCGGPPVVKAKVDGNRKEDNTAWVDVGDCSSGKALGLLQWCLIGKWETRAEPTPGEKMVEIWGREVWRLNEGLRVATLNEELLFLEFDSPEEANRVLVSGIRNFRGRVLQLERWNPYYGCIRNKGSAQEEWVRLVGLPLHLWKTEVLKKIGDACGGFVAIDKNTERRMELRWARILIKSTGLLGQAQSTFWKAQGRSSSRSGGRSLHGQQTFTLCMLGLLQKAQRKEKTEQHALRGEWASTVPNAMTKGCKGCKGWQGSQTQGVRRVSSGQVGTGWGQIIY